MNLTKTLGLAFLGATLLFTSCKKDDDDDSSNNSPACKVNRAIFTSSGTSSGSDTTAFIYSGDKLTKLTNNGNEVAFEYSGDRITKRSYLTAGSSNPVEVDLVSYNSDGTISKVEYTDQVSGSTFTPFWRVEFTYTSGKITKLTEYDLTNGSAEKAWEYTYTYTGNNITKVDETDYTLASPETTSYNYAYDSNNNYFKKQNVQAMLIDPYLGGEEGIFLPLFYSANNVTSISTTGGSLPISYTTDDKQNLKDISLVSPLAQLKVNYSYLCQ
jgi:hypothetical protein